VILDHCIEFAENLLPFLGLADQNLLQVGKGITDVLVFVAIAKGVR
jgi:hypothetical protein